MYFDALLEILNFTFYFAEFILKLSNKSVFLKNITIFRGVHLATCMPSCGDHFVRMADTCIRIPRPLKSWDYFLAGKIVLMHWWSIWYVYQIPSLRKIVEYLLPRNHTERSNSLERRKYAEFCASCTHAQIKKFLPDVALSSDMNNYRNLYLSSHFLSITSHCI